MAKKEKEVVAETTPKLMTIDDWAPSNARVQLMHPKTLELSDHWIELAGMDSDEFTDAVLYMIKKAKNSTVKIEDLEEEERFKQNTKDEQELTARCITAWDEAFFGPFSTQKAIEVMQKHKWVYVQVKKFLDDRENFYMV